MKVKLIICVAIFLSLLLFIENAFALDNCNTYGPRIDCNGSIKYPNGDYYTGHFSNDKFNDTFGGYIFSSGHVFFGVFKDGIRDGYGKLWGPSNSLLCEGNWRNGENKNCQFTTQTLSELSNSTSSSNKFQNDNLSKEKFNFDLEINKLKTEIDILKRNSSDLNEQVTLLKIIAKNLNDEIEILKNKKNEIKSSPSNKDKCLRLGLIVGSADYNECLKH